MPRHSVGSQGSKKHGILMRFSATFTALPRSAVSAFPPARLYLRAFGGDDFALGTPSPMHEYHHAKALQRRGKNWLRG